MVARLVRARLSGHLIASRELETTCERLERRQLLAGTVTANISGAGDLTISGDNQANEISVEIADDGQVSITGLNGTTVNQGNLASEKVQRNIRINLRGGDDVLTLSGSGSSLPVYDVKINSGSGNDSISLLEVYGIGRDVKINAGSNDDFVDVQYAGIGRNLAINGSSGRNEIRVADTEVAEDGVFAKLKISSTSGEDSVFIDRTTVYGNLDVNTGSGNDRIEIEDTFASEGGDFNIRSGSGNDEVRLTNSSTYTPVGSEKYGSVSIKTSGGDDVVQIENMDNTPLLLNAGSGSDEVTITGSQLDGFDARLGGGDDLVDFGPSTEINAEPYRINGGGGIDEVRGGNTVATTEPMELISIENIT